MEDIEEKARLYDEALKEAAIVHKDEDRHLKATLERIFPALKESEDEKARKGLIGHLKECRNQCRSEVMIREYAKWIAWLEKQKTSEEAMKYLKENHSPSEVSDFQAAMNIAVAKAYDKGKADAISEMQNHVWTEEDEKMVRALMSICDEWATRHSYLPKENNDIEKIKNWLQSLKVSNNITDEKLDWSAAIRYLKKRT